MNSASKTSSNAIAYWLGQKSAQTDGGFGRVAKGLGLSTADAPEIVRGLALDAVARSDERRVDFGPQVAAFLRRPAAEVRRAVQAELTGLTQVDRTTFATFLATESRHAALVARGGAGMDMLRKSQFSGKDVANALETLDALGIAPHMHREDLDRTSKVAVMEWILGQFRGHLEPVVDTRKLLKLWDLFGSRLTGLPDNPIRSAVAAERAEASATIGAWRKSVASGYLAVPGDEHWAVTSPTNQDALVGRLASAVFSGADGSLRIGRGIVSAVEVSSETVVGGERSRVTTYTIALDQPIDGKDSVSLRFDFFAGIPKKPPFLAIEDRSTVTLKDFAAEAKRRGLVPFMSPEFDAIFGEASLDGRRVLAFSADETNGVRTMVEGYIVNHEGAAFTIQPDHGGDVVPFFAHYGYNFAVSDSSPKSIATFDAECRAAGLVGGTRAAFVGRYGNDAVGQRGRALVGTGNGQTVELSFDRLLGGRDGDLAFEHSGRTIAVDERVVRIFVTKPATTA